MRRGLEIAGLALLALTLGCGRALLDVDGDVAPGAGGTGSGGSETPSSSTSIWTGTGGGWTTSSTGTGASAGGTTTGTGAGGGWTSSWTSGTGGGWTSSGSTGTGAGGGWTSSWTSGTGGGWTSSWTSTSTNPTCASYGDPCTGCMADACPETYCDCVGDQECLNVIECSNNCGDEACSSDCMSKHPDGISKAILLGDCAATVCKSSCPGSENELSPCELCLYSDCSSAMDTCLSQPVCLDLWSCLASCSNLDLACQKGCYNQHAGGVAPLQALFQCSEQSCSGACQ